MAWVRLILVLGFVRTSETGYSLQTHACRFFNLHFGFWVILIFRIMKNLFLLLPFLFLSCSSSDDTPVIVPPANSSTGDFHPPLWIQGIWGSYDMGFASDVYKFTIDDFYKIPFSYQNIIDNSEVGGSVIEEISDTDYNLTITVGLTQSVLLFHKIDDTHIRCTTAQNIRTYSKKE